MIATCLLMAASLLTDETATLRRIENHLLIHDTVTAEQEAREACQKYPESLSVQEAALKAFSQSGSEEEALLAFSRWKALSKEGVPRRVYEELAWGTIAKGETSSFPTVRVISLLAAYFGQDARGLKIIERRLSDPNALVRLVAAQTASKLLDEPIKRAVLSKFETENDWEVRLELIRALGAMKMTGMKPRLIEIIADGKTTMEEKGAAIEALLAMLETVPKSELETLSNSDRASLRALSAKIITFLHEKEAFDILLKLLPDERAEVRGQALLACGVLRYPPDATVRRLLKDPAFSVQLAAAYTILVSGSHEADSWIEDALFLEKVEDARIVASMLVSAGSYGKSLAKKELAKASDFYVRMNLALAALDGEALEVLYRGVLENRERWSREQKGVFRPLVPSKETHRPLVPNWPEFVNKQTRLEILNLLAIKEHPQALEATRAFLKESDWGLSGMTSALLLTEGDDGADELIRKLLHDDDENVRLQAALILARWDQQEDTTSILIQNYDNLPRDKKEIVLDALGKIGSEEAIAFLVKEMASPHSTMRLIASAALLRSLYD